MTRTVDPLFIYLNAPDRYEEAVANARLAVETAQLIEARQDRDKLVRFIEACLPAQRKRRK